MSFLDNKIEVKNEHRYANMTIRGDLSSFKWFEGPLTANSPSKKNKSLIEVGKFYYRTIFLNVFFVSNIFSF